MIGAAVLGAGRIGALHARTLARSLRAELLMVADPVLERALAVCHGGVATDNAEDVWNDARVRAVVIASSTEHHAGQVEAAARAGKAVFCEKPVSLDLARARQALEAVEAAGVPFQIGFQRRYDSGFAAAAEQLAVGRIGVLELFRSLSCDPAPAPLDYLERSGGIFCDMTIHDIDLARWFGGEVDEVNAHGAAVVVPELSGWGDADTVALTLRYRSGALGVIQNRRRSGCGTDIRTELFGSQGKLVVEQERDVAVRRYDEAGAHHGCPVWFLDRFRPAYQSELEAFVAAVEDGASPSPGIPDALESLRIALAATRSFRQGRPVRLDEI